MLSLFLVTSCCSFPRPHSIPFPVKAWIEQLIVQENWEWGAKHLGARGQLNWNATAANRRAFLARRRHPLPPRIAFVFCQAEACAIGKT